MYNPYGIELYDEDTFVINSNDRIQKRISEYKEELLHKKERELQKRVSDFVENLEYDEEGKPIIPLDEEGYYIIPMDDMGNPLVNIDEEGNLILDAVETEPDVSDYDEPVPEEVSATASEIIDNANRQAEQIMADAQANAEEFINQAKEQGYSAGYEEGLAQARSELSERENELAAERQRMEEELNAAKDAVEGELVDIICDVVERTFKIQFGDTKEIILHLVDRVLMGAGASKTFIIRVNDKNYGFLTENKESLLARLGSDVTLDIINDPLLGDDACMVESDGGVFNCGLDVQLDSLFKELKIIGQNIE